MTVEIHDLDPFDLPDWLGVEPVVWSAERSVRSTHLVPGTLERPAVAGEEPLPCDLLAVDQAYPHPVADGDVRSRAHQAWRHGEVLLVSHRDRAALAVPGSDFTADRVLDAMERLARAVGASPERYAVRLRVGRDRRLGA